MLDADKLGRSNDRDNKIRPLPEISVLYSTPNFEAFLLRHFPGYENKSLLPMRLYPNWQKSGLSTEGD